MATDVSIAIRVEASVASINNSLKTLGYDGIPTRHRYPKILRAIQLEHLANALASLPLVFLADVLNDQAKKDAAYAIVVESLQAEAEEGDDDVTPPDEGEASTLNETAIAGDA